MFPSRGSLSSLLLAFSLTVPWVAADPSAGCGAVEERPVDWIAKGGDVKIFSVNGRNVRVTVPLKYNKTSPAPVIIAFHDKEQSPDYLEYESALGDQKLNPDAIVVYPTAEDVFQSYTRFQYEWF